MVSIIRIVTEKETSVYEFDSIYTCLTAVNVTEGITAALADGNDDDIIGIMTHGRYLVRNNQPLIKPYIERVMKEYDLIIPMEGTIASGSSEPERVFEPGAVIARRSFLREFYTHAKQVLGDLEDEMAVMRLLKARIFDKHLHAKSESVSKTDPEIWNNGHKKISVVQNYMDSVLKDYITLRQQDRFAECFAGEDPHPEGFGGKIPVWVCWWQGLDEAPTLIKACIDSLKKNLPENEHLVVITLDNWQEYVTFTDAVIDKFNRNIITYTHLSDILRAELLYRYGGMWIDATYYVSHPIEPALIEQELYSLRFDPPLWGMDLQRGRWTLSLLVSHKHHPAIQFLMEGLWFYWEQADELVDYFTVDYVLDSGYRHFDMIREAFDGIAVSPSSVYDLQLKLNQRATEAEIQWLKDAGTFYKINRRGEYKEKTEHGFDSIYGYLLGNKTYEYRDKESVPVEITVTGENGLVNAIREVNPSVVLDIDGYFAANAYVSRGIIDDVILHELCIYQGPDAEERGAASGVYNDGIDKPEDMTCAAVIVADCKYRLECY